MKYSYYVRTITKVKSLGWCPLFLNPLAQLTFCPTMSLSSPPVPPRYHRRAHSLSAAISSPLVIPRPIPPPPPPPLSPPPPRLVLPSETRRQSLHRHSLSAPQQAQPPAPLQPGIHSVRSPAVPAYNPYTRQMQSVEPVKRTVSLTVQSRRMEPSEGRKIYNRPPTPFLPVPAPMPAPAPTPTPTPMRTPTLPTRMRPPTPTPMRTQTLPPPPSSPPINPFTKLKRLFSLKKPARSFTLSLSRHFSLKSFRHRNYAAHSPTSPTFQGFTSSNVQVSQHGEEVRKVGGVEADAGLSQVGSLGSSPLSSVNSAGSVNSVHSSTSVCSINSACSSTSERSLQSSLQTSPENTPSIIYRDHGPSPAQIPLSSAMLGCGETFSVSSSESEVSVASSSSESLEASDTDTDSDHVLPNASFESMFSFVDNELDLEFSFVPLAREIQDGDQPGQFEQSDRPGQTGQSGQTEQTEQSVHPGQSEQYDRTEQTEKNVQLDQIQQSVQTEQTDQPDQSDQPDQRVQPTNSHPTVTFASTTLIYNTYASLDYDRRAEPCTCSRLTPLLASQIKHELNTFKMHMTVHAESRGYTHFYL